MNENTIILIILAYILMNNTNLIIQKLDKTILIL